jgi:4-diphosphocytidyl-2-C-methyl-D-erythritol kinase
MNLTLCVRGVRADGYHEIESLVVRVGLYDELTVTPRTDGELHLTCDDPAVPTDRRNLVLRAAQELRNAVPAPVQGVSVRLTKRIPAGAGLGGGSSDAAAALLLLNELWALRLDAQRVAMVGAEIGSDVPLFLGPPVCILRGRGTDIEPLTIPLHGFAVLAIPDIHSATAAVYAAADRITRRPSSTRLDDLVNAIESSPNRAMDRLFNDLEPAAHIVNPGLRDFAAQLRAVSGAVFCMSGSGSAYFTLTADQATAESIATMVRAATRVRTEVVHFPAQ